MTALQHVLSLPDQVAAVLPANMKALVKIVIEEQNASA